MSVAVDGTRASWLRLALLPYLAARDTARLGFRTLVPPSLRAWEEAVGAGVAWLCRTHDVTGRRGCSTGFSLVHGWQPALPETTGQVIGTLLTYGRRTGSSDAADRAHQLGDWAIEIQNYDQGIIRRRANGEEKPSTIFETGMVIHGWLDLHKVGRHGRYLEAALRAAQFLVRNLGGDGIWRGDVEHEKIAHPENSRVSWALLRLAQVTGEESFAAAARRQLDWALSVQQDNGWFEWCFSAPGIQATTQEIASTLQGLLEAHAITKHEPYLKATLRTSEVLIKKLEVHGRLWGTFDRNWKPARHECLTGTAELGGVWLRLYELTDDVRFLNAGLKAVDHAAIHQTRIKWPSVRGALPGSHPIYGPYAPLQFPTRGTKCLVDGLMTREAILSSDFA